MKLPNHLQKFATVWQFNNRIRRYAFPPAIVSVVISIAVGACGLERTSGIVAIVGLALGFAGMVAEVADFVFLTAAVVLIRRHFRGKWLS